MEDAEEQAYNLVRILKQIVTKEGQNTEKEQEQFDKILSTLDQKIIVDKDKSLKIS